MPEGMHKERLKNMSEKISIVKKIMELLADKEMSSVELAPMLEIPVGNCSSYLNTLMNDGRIIRITDTKPYKYNLATPLKELLKQLYSIMNNKMTKKEDLTDEEMEYLTEIEEVLGID